MKDGRGNRLWGLMAFFYEQFFKRFPPHRKLLQEIVETVVAPPPGFLLDAGCGPGLLNFRTGAAGA